MALSGLLGSFSRLCIGRSTVVSAVAGPSRALYATKAPTGVPSPVFAASAAIAEAEAGDEVVEVRDKRGRVIPRTQNYRTSNFRVSPKKLNKLAQQIRGLPIDEAILQMHFSHKKPRITIRNMLHNAKATAANVAKLDKDVLFVKEAYIGKGRYEKRMLFHGRGRFGIMTRKSSHMKVVLEERTEAVQEQYLLRTMRQMLKERAKRYVKGSTVDLKPATNVPLYSKTIRADRVL